MSEQSTFKVDTNQTPSPSKSTGGSGQVGKMPSNAEIHKMAKDEDEGKC